MSSSERADGNSAKNRHFSGIWFANLPTDMDWNVAVIAPREYRFTHFLYDTARLLAFSIRELGTDCCVTYNRLEPKRINVLVGVHLIEDLAFVTKLVDSQVRYVVLQTEMVHNGNINQENNDRFERILHPLLRGAAAIWDWAPENARALEAMGHRATVLEFGYQARMRELEFCKRRDVDFFFFGSVTEHRRHVLAELQRLGYQVEVYFDEASVFRNAMLERSEVVLSLQQSPQMPHVPHQRIIYLVTNGCLVAGEGGVNQKPVEDLFAWCKPGGGVDETVEHLRQVRARKDRYELAEEFRKRLTERPMSRFLAPLVRTVNELA